MTGIHYYGRMAAECGLWDGEGRRRNALLAGGNDDARRKEDANDDDDEQCISDMLEV